MRLGKRGRPLSVNADLMAIADSLQNAPGNAEAHGKIETTWERQITITSNRIIVSQAVCYCCK